MTDESHALRPAGAARLALLLAVAWLLAGALFKLVAGSPNDLPRTIQEFPLLKPEWTFRLAIGVELSIGALALVRPRIGWILIVLLFAFFDFLLYQLIEAGETSCGCFGGNAPEWLTPVVMMVIDSVLLLGVLVTRPWSRFGPARPTLLPGPVLTLLLVGGLLALPWHPGIFRTGPAPNLGNGTESGEESEEEDRGDSQIDWYRFVPSRWEGEVFTELDLMGFVEGVESVDDLWTLFPTGAPTNVVLYRNSCEHCREHFERLLREPLPDGTQLVLIRIPEQGDGDNVIEDVKPTTAYADLSLEPLPKGYGITTPVIFDIDPVTFQVRDVVQGGEEGG